MIGGENIDLDKWDIDFFPPSDQLPPEEDEESAGDDEGDEEDEEASNSMFKNREINLVKQDWGRSKIKELFKIIVGNIFLSSASAEEPAKTEPAKAEKKKVTKKPKYPRRAKAYTVCVKLKSKSDPSKTIDGNCHEIPPKKKKEEPEVGEPKPPKKMPEIAPRAPQYPLPPMPNVSPLRILRRGAN